MFKYRWMSQTQWILKHIDEETIEQVWSNVNYENPELADEEVAGKVEGYFGIQNRLQTNPS